MLPTAGAGPSGGGGMALALFDDELGVLPRSSLRSKPGGVLGVFAISTRLCSCCVGSRFPNSQHGMTMWPEGAISAWKQSVPGGSAVSRCSPRVLQSTSSWCLGQEWLGSFLGL